MNYEPWLLSWDIKRVMTCRRKTRVTRDMIHQMTLPFTNSRTSGWSGTARGSPPLPLVSGTASRRRRRLSSSPSSSPRRSRWGKDCVCSHVVVWVFQAYTRQDYITLLCTFMHRGNDCRVSSMDGRKELFMILNSTSIYMWNLFGAENCH